MADLRREDHLCGSPRSLQQGWWQEVSLPRRTALRAVRLASPRTGKRLSGDLQDLGGLRAKRATLMGGLMAWRGTRKGAHARAGRIARDGPALFGRMENVK
jgi:hypothetical protein